MHGMKTETFAPSTEGAIWARIVNPTTGDLTAAAARTFLRFDFRSADQERMNELAEKARTGTLTPGERQVAEAYNRVAHLLALLHSKARQALTRSRKKR
jgi:hypothetical protein